MSKRCIAKNKQQSSETQRNKYISWQTHFNKKVFVSVLAVAWVFWSSKISNSKRDEVSLFRVWIHACIGIMEWINSRKWKNFNQTIRRLRKKTLKWNSRVSADTASRFCLLKKVKKHMSTIFLNPQLKYNKNPENIEEH